MPTIIDVDRATYTALQLSQAAIAFARHHLPYGSGNQIKDLLKMREGGFSGQTLPRLDAVRTSRVKLMELDHANLNLLGLNDQTFYRGISAGLALYYGAGNCGEHADLLFNFLVTFGFPGITVLRVSSTIMDHGYCVLNWKGCQDPVVCDAWPTTPQACRWSEFFANPKRTNPDPGFVERAQFKITDETMGFDLLGNAFRAIDPGAISKLPPQSKSKGYSQQAILNYLNQEPKGVYNQVYTVAQAYQPYVDYRYTDQSNNKHLLTQESPSGEQWTGKVQAVIKEIQDNFGNPQAQLIDPNQRYK